jgi:O-antigen/teichoic acid export membrane protein
MFSKILIRQVIAFNKYVRAVTQRKFVRDSAQLQAARFIATVITFATSLIIFRQLSVSVYGTWVLVQSFYGLVSAVNILGIPYTVSEQLGAAIGMRDQQQAARIIAFSLQTGWLWTVILGMFFITVGYSLSSALYDGDASISSLAAMYALVGLANTCYATFLTTLSLNRLARYTSIVEILNQIVYGLSMLGALWFLPTTNGLVIAYGVQGVITAVIAVSAYQHAHHHSSNVILPKLSEVFQEVFRPFSWRLWVSGTITGLTRNLSMLFIQIPSQLIVIFIGREALGYLHFLLHLINNINILSTAVFDNAEAVFFQATGRRDFDYLKKNFLRLCLGMLIVNSVILGIFVLVAPILAPILYTDKWLISLPVLIPITLYSLTASMGGFAALILRAYQVVHRALFGVIVALLAMLIPTVWLIQNYGVIGGAWAISMNYMIYVVSNYLIAFSLMRSKLAVQQP